MEHDIYVSNAGFRVADVHGDGEFVHCFPQGGGYALKIPLAEWVRDGFRVEDVPPPYQPVQVTGDWMEGGSVVAYVNGDKWNGWAMPYFPLDSAMSLLQTNSNLSYDYRGDRFVSVMDPEDPDESTEEYLPTTIVVDGEHVTVYPIGTGSWTWEEV